MKTPDKGGIQTDCLLSMYKHSLKDPVAYIPVEDSR